MSSKHMLVYKLNWYNTLGGRRGVEDIDGGVMCHQ